MSQDLVWQLIRKNHSHLVRRDGISLSSEPGNLTNTHSFKYSGIANNRVLDITADSKGKITAARRLRRGSRKPATANSITALNKHRYHGQNASGKIISTLVDGYRGDLKRAAVARYSALHRATAVKGTQINSKRRRTPSSKK